MKENEKIASALYFEGMTSIRAVIKGSKSGINDRKIKKVFIDQNIKKNKVRDITYLKRQSEELGFVIEYCSREIIDSLSVGSSHGGIIADCTERSYNTSLPTPSNNSFYVMLDGIEDPFNFGYTLRSLYAFGADAILLPERNWMSAAGIVCRSSAGASELLNIYAVDCEEAVNYYKKRNVSIVSTAKENSMPISDVEIKFPLLLIIGGEKRGISKKIVSLSDHIARIDYSRNADFSLSAASAAAVLGYEISQRKIIVKNQ